ncbi:hypothetical protein QYE76_014414 [Lolium multiflorum]|uniref:Uncharacterized protein n=1 Tax=Lolium multiflorum TaxID=4521 RepID=A0AAD8U2Z1_LOLMU|nr:hypothetical protein QYE76_014414 [Lolium multiflorum]
MASLQMEPPAPPPRKSVSSCDLHPDEAFTGFCAGCLRERLAGLEASDVAPAAPGRRSTSAIRSLFSRPFAAPSASAPLPDLRRCKSFSCGRGGDALADEPQRWSCDARGRSTLWALFHRDDRERVRDGTAFAAFPASSSAAAAALPFEVQQQMPPPPCVPEVFLEEEIVMAEIAPVVEPIVAADLETEAYATGEVRPMKDHIDLETSQTKKPPPPPMDLKEIAGSFWVAASVFSKKWQKWRRKQKIKKEEAAAGSKAAAAAMPPSGKPSKPSFLQRSRTRGGACSEFAGGRRSCDTDPRFSLDAARMSVDDAGVSWDGPRASWDGYLFGAGAGIGLGRAPPAITRLPPILSALEGSPTGILARSDGQIPVEDDSQPEPDGDANTPGGSAQTRDYYMDTSSRRRRSLDHSSSARRRSFEVPDPKPVPAAAAIANARESPVIVGSAEFYHFQHAEDLLDHRFSTSSLVDDFPRASLDAAKKPRRKAWSLWDFIHRRATGRRSGASASDVAFSEPWPELRGRGCNANARTTMQRCGSNASARSSFSSTSGGMGSSRRCFVDGGVKSRHEDRCVLERNRSARYSPVAHQADNGMLRLYLTPLRSASGRRAGGLPANGGGRHLRSQSFARTMLRLY